MLNRVVITGFGNVCAFGRDWASIKQNLAQQKSAVVYMSEWDIFGEELNTRLGAPIQNYAPPAHWSRKDTRSMGKVAMLGVDAANEALADAGLLEDECIKDGRMGVAAGSCSGDAKATGEVVDILRGKDSTLNANSYVKMMPHTVAANIAIHYGLKGRLIPTGSACTSASQAIGYSYEAIKFGLIDMMLAGDADELHPSQAFVFDKLYATSCKNDAPTLSPAPFDISRDGLVLGEGGAISKGMAGGKVVGECASLDEIASKYGVPADALKESVKKYSEGVKAKKDEFGKQESALSEINEAGPFYVIRLSPKPHHTMGGLKINAKAEVISSKTNKPIPGLYAAGEITGGTHGASRLGTVAITDCIVFGMIAGEQIA